MPAPVLLVAALLLSTLHLTGCAGLRHIEPITGQCAEEQDRCVAEQCGQVVDPVPCEELCAFEAQSCERRQGTAGRPRARMGDDQALLIDLRGERLAHSSALSVETGGEVTVEPGARSFAPNAFLKVTFQLPPDTRQAEVALTHAPGTGGPCLLTLTAGAGTLLGLYQPPTGMKLETFDFTRQLPKVPPGQPVPVTLTLFNNGAAGSRVPYRLAEVQIFYRALQRPPVAGEVE